MLRNQTTRLRRREAEMQFGPVLIFNLLLDESAHSRGQPNL